MRTKESTADEGNGATQVSFAPRGGQEINKHAPTDHTSPHRKLTASSSPNPLAKHAAKPSNDTGMPPGVDLLRSRYADGMSTGRSSYNLPAVT
jgi:hypothetical protein